MEDKSEYATLAQTLPRKATDRFFTLAGLVCVGLGAAGIVLPLLPTTPFLFLAAACFGRSSPRLNRWLHTNRFFGPYLSRYRNGEGIPLTAKIAIISMLWLSLAASALLVIPETLWPVRVALALTGIGVSIHILRIRTYQTRTESSS